MTPRLPLAVTLAVTLTSAAFAQAPSRLGYQGRLVKSDGSAVSGLTSITFSLFATATGGAPLWQETQQLGLSDGYYATFLGDVSDGGVGSALFDGTERFVELSVGGATLTPRQRVASVAYALNAEAAKSVKGGTVQATAVSVNGAPVVSLSVAGCSAGNVLQWTGSAWACAALPAATASSPGVVQVGAGLSMASGTLSVSVGTTAGTVAAGDDARLSATVPTGAVMAFNLAACPTGWSALTGAAGRFIVGAGTLGSDTYALLGTGGEARHVLTIAEMPAHAHNIGGIYGRADLSGTTNNINMAGAGTGTYYGPANEGGSGAHETRPPFLALLYCQKN